MREGNQRTSRKEQEHYLGLDSSTYCSPREAKSMLASSLHSHPMPSQERKTYLFHLADLCSPAAGTAIFCT
jgi:hypothetical protein